MKFSIKSFNEFLLVIIIGSAAIFSFEYARVKPNFIPNDIHYYYNPNPTNIFISIEAVDAIEIFRGNEPVGYVFGLKTISVLVSVIIFLMVGPYLVYLGYKNAHSDKIKPWYWFLGMIVFVGSVSIIPASMLSIKVFDNTKKSSEISSYNDQIREELSDITAAIVQYEFVGEGISENFKLDDLKIDDLMFNHEVVGVLGDTLVRIESLNPNRTTYEALIEVRPYEEDFMKWVKNY